MDWELSVSERSFERAGITKDIDEAVCEYIWNGFEAGATNVSVSITGDTLQEAKALVIVDNGTGIDFSTLDDTFRSFLASLKHNEKLRIKSQKNKGKGRFSFTAFANTVLWNTVYCDDAGELWNYTISIDAAAKRSFRTTERKAVSGITTGTRVEIPITSSAIEEALSFDSMHEKLLEEFSWYLMLKKCKNLSLNYFGNKVDYSQHVDDELSRKSTFHIQSNEFEVNTVVWQRRVDNGSKIYYLSSEGELRFVENTTFNKNTVAFFHAVYVRSKFFNDLEYLDNTDEEITLQIIPDEKTSVLRQIKAEIIGEINDAFNNFLRRKADDHVKSIYDNELAPHFSDDPYDQMRKSDFEKITREIYCVEPRIFYQLKPMQEKSLLGFLSLLLSSNERESILDILTAVIDLTPEQRTQFARVLKRTKLEHIIDLIDLLKKRCDTITELKKIIYEYGDFANERDHIQRIIEQNYWIFGENYNLVTADRELQTSLKEFEALTGVNENDEPLKNEADRIQRLDVFLYGSQNKFNGKKECIVIELKAPKINLTSNVFSQIQRYANIIRKEPRFQSKERTWRFIAVGKKVSDDVTVKYQNFIEKGKLGLADIIENIELYALSWDDVFTAFENRHAALLDKLQKDLRESGEITDQDAVPSRKMVDEITDTIISTPPTPRSVDPTPTTPVV